MCLLKRNEVQNQIKNLFFKKEKDNGCRGDFMLHEG